MYFPLRKLKRLLLLLVFMFIVYIIANFFKRSSESYTANNLGLAKNNTDNVKVNKLIPTSFDLRPLLNVTNSTINYNVHIFYYAWYGNIEIDKAWRHWDHLRLPHWNKAIRGDFDQSRHVPPDDIGADFYPALGLYSSKDKRTRQLHLEMIRYTGVGVIIFSWYPGNFSDPNGGPVDCLVSDMLDDAHKLNLKVALHIEPYPGRSITSIKKDLLYIHSRYSRHPAYYRRARLGQHNSLPVVFIYDSYQISGSDWYKVFGKNQPLTIRKKKEDFFVIGLFYERDSCNQLRSAGFDGTYTYFVSPLTTYGSSSSNWEDISRRCAAAHIDFFPSLGPGYKDISVRPWNGMAIQDRDDGQFYSRAFREAEKLNLSSFGITSFNEWHEGTQIEPAIPHGNRDDRFKYEDYSPRSPMFYLDLTRSMVHSFTYRSTFPRGIWY